MDSDQVSSDTDPVRHSFVLISKSVMSLKWSIHVLMARMQSTLHRGQQSTLDLVLSLKHPVSLHNEDVDGYFCKVKPGMDMIAKHPGKRIVYVDSDAIVDLRAVQDAVCSRLTMGLHPLGMLVSTSWFRFPGDEHSLHMLRSSGMMRGSGIQMLSGTKRQ